MRESIIHLLNSILGGEYFTGSVKIDDQLVTIDRPCKEIVFTNKVNPTEFIGIFTAIVSVLGDYDLFVTDVCFINSATLIGAQGVQIKWS
ncbi:hypothetical protein [Bacteroides sp.]|uniref:hypothetical protein n=1 Tax=Bacteroides sp. TaxID=29523 RepID=UPI0026050EAA|nr:hypothetical protein [Bacteroides sp.]MDD3039548.1 hypothetical protein [Bacteroides sp.]